MEAVGRCVRFLASKSAVSARDLLTEVAAARPECVLPGLYGEGVLVERLESRVARLFGKERPYATWDNGPACRVESLV
jgi:hypothetical protein